MQQQQQEFMLSINNLPSGVNNDKLRAIFSQWNPTKARVVFRNGSFLAMAAINFGNMTDLQNAKESVHQIDGQPVVCEIASKEWIHKWFSTKPKAKKKKVEGEDISLLASRPFDSQDVGQPNRPPFQGQSFGQPFQGQPSFQQQPFSSGPSPQPFGYQGTSPHGFQGTPQFPGGGQPSPQGFQGGQPPQGSFQGQPSGYQGGQPSQGYQGNQPGQFGRQPPRVQGPPHGQPPTKVTRMPSMEFIPLAEDIPFNYSAIPNITEFHFFEIQFETAVSVGSFVLPCEVGIVSFSIATGEIRSWHRFIDPGPIPVGYIGEAKWRTENKHSIPYRDFKLCEKNYKKLWAELIGFIQPPNKAMPMLWSKAPSLTNSCLRWLAERATQLSSVPYVRELEEIAMELHKLANDPKYPSTIINYFNLETVPQRPKCDYHSKLEKKDASCALSTARSGAEIIRKLGSTLSLTKGFPRQSSTTFAPPVSTQQIPPFTSEAPPNWIPPSAPMGTWSGTFPQ